MLANSVKVKLTSCGVKSRMRNTISGQREGEEKIEKRERNK